MTAYRGMWIEELDMDQRINAARCPKLHPGGPWRCTKRRHHTGDHVAYVPVSDTSKAPASWPAARQKPSRQTETGQ